MKVLLLGGSGFIGRAVKQALLSAEHEIKALGRGQMDVAALLGRTPLGAKNFY